jgi:hypothetical protein
MSTQQEPEGAPQSSGSSGSGTKDSGTEDDGNEDAGASRSQAIRGWFVGRLPDGWFAEPADITVDREEITIIGRIEEPAGTDSPPDAALGRMKRFREDTRGRRIEIAREAEHRFGRKVSWGVRCAEQFEMFTTLSVPVMTRLRQPERRVLDTLVDAGVARSRSDALAWCVRLTGEHAEDWLTQLRAALRKVEEVREQGPV